VKTFLKLGLLLMAGQASAQAVYKCGGEQGVAYQSTPCSRVALKQWSHVDEIAVPGGVLTRAEAERRIAATRKAWQASATPPRVPRATRRLKTTDAARVARPRLSDCERARAARGAAHARRGVRWSFDDASRWDAKVFKVCR
jgi:hypothetical protein